VSPVFIATATGKLDRDDEMPLSAHDAVLPFSFYFPRFLLAAQCPSAIQERFEFVELCGDSGATENMHARPAACAQPGRAD
jgi:hypothetical protein